MPRYNFGPLGTGRRGPSRCRFCGGGVGLRKRETRGRGVGGGVGLRKRETKVGGLTGAVAAMSLTNRETQRRRNATSLNKRLSLGRRKRERLSVLALTAA